MLNHLQYLTDSLTLEAWVRTDKVSSALTNRTIFSKRSEITGGNPPQWDLILRNRGQIAFIFDRY